MNAFLASAGLTFLFLIVYPGCLWITSKRSDIGSLYFEWERNIPFIPVFILPYMSIDLFFVGAPFLCRTGRELKTFSKRVIMAILAAGVCFLLFPLRFAFPRPPVAGWLGALFDWFRSLDAPYNLAPSLHVAFCLLLGDIYARHLRGLFRIAIVLWFGLIALSPLLTFQHHFIDVMSGFALAGYCFYFFRQQSEASPVVRNRRVGLYYLGGTISVLFLSAALLPWGALLLWPAASLALVTAAYFGLGPDIFNKRNGRLPWSTRFVLGPCLFGQYLSLLCYRRRCRSWSEINDRVWMGGKLREHEARVAGQAGVTAVLDLTAEFSETKILRGCGYRNIPILDLSAPTQDQLAQMSEFIEEQSRHGVVYVHCKIGYSRSAAAIAAYLLASGQVVSAEEAFAILREKRPGIVIRPEIVLALSEFERQCVHDPASFLLVSARTVPS